MKHSKSFPRRAMEMSTSTVVGLFANPEDADLGMTRLLRAGFRPQHIGLRQAIAGQIVVTARVTDARRGTIAAAVLRDSSAIEVSSPIAA